ATIGVALAVARKVGETIGERDEFLADRSGAIESAREDRGVERGDRRRGATHHGAVARRRDGAGLLSGERARETVVVGRDPKEYRPGVTRQLRCALAVVRRVRGFGLTRIDAGREPRDGKDGREGAAAKRGASPVR